MRMKKMFAIFGVIGGAIALVTAGLGAQPTDRATSEPIERYDVASARLTVPAGTAQPIVLDSYVASDTSLLEDPVRAHISRNVIVRGVTVIPAGSTLVGHVSSVERSG